MNDMTFQLILKNLFARCREDDVDFLKVRITLVTGDTVLTDTSEITYIPSSGYIECNVDTDITRFIPLSSILMLSI